MSREELKDMLKPTVAFDTLGEMGSVKGLDELVNAMVAAYNLGVDAALEHLEVKKIDAWWKDNLRKKLKI